MDLKTVQTIDVGRPADAVPRRPPVGRLHILADPQAQASPRAMRRYADPFYRANQRLTATGYNLLNLGGI